MKYLLKIDLNNFEEKVLENVLIDGPEVLKKPVYVENINGKFLLIGDCINLSEFSEKLAKGNSIESIVASLNGNFHLYFFNRQKKKLLIFNSLWGIISLYYKITNRFAFFSSSLNLLKEATNSQELNKKYLFQSVIFNYSLCDDTFWREISLLPVNTFMTLSNNGNFKILRYFNLEDHFVSSPKGGQKVLHELSELFIYETAKWFPEERFAVSFTGGFDGRTLVSIAKYFNQDFFTYSFGSTGASDTELPRSQAKELGIEFQAINLDENYAVNYYRNHFSDIIKNSEGRAGINRSHYNYAAELLQNSVRYILTGNFGSELFRSLHLTGALFSRAMYLVINDSKDYTWIADIESLPEFRALNKKYFHHEWEETIYDIKQIIKGSNIREKNLWAYKFVFEEVFRKYFGAEIRMQFNYLINRTPYLNITFIKELLKSKYAGAYGPFFTHNPIKRFKGQELYAHIIKKTSQYLFNAYTNKGYRPKDLLQESAKVKLVMNYVKKKLLSRLESENDPFGVISSFESNKDSILLLNNQSAFFSQSIITKHLLDSNSENVGLALRILSLIYYLKTEGINGKI